MIDPFEEEAPKPAPRRAEIMRPLADLVKVDDDVKALRKIETKVLTKSMEVVQDALCFADIEMGGKGLPDQWIDEVGPERAQQRLRVAQMAQMNAKEAPVGLRIAKEVMVGVIKARATEKGAPPALNLHVTKIDFQLPQFPVLPVEK